MTIKQHGGVFGRNPKFNSVEAESLSIAGNAVPDASTILVDGDIGSTVQGYDADTAKYDDTTANFTGTLQNGGSNVLVDTDIGSTVQGYDADTAKVDVAETWTALQTFNSGAVVGSTSLNGQIVKARQNYYQIRDQRTVASGTVNFLSIDIGSSTYFAGSVRINSFVISPGISNFSRVEELYIKRASSGGLTVTSKLSEGDSTGNTVSSSISGNIVYLFYTYNASVGLQTNSTYVEIMGMNGVSSETAFTVTIL